MIRDIVRLSDTVASEICTPRVDMMVANVNDQVKPTIDRMRGTGYTRLPISNSDSDEIVGIVNFKDLTSALLDGNEMEEVSKYMFEPKYIPESKDVIKLLEEMQAEHMQMAIVIDEYGGTEGLITIEDIVEEIVGEIVDESDDFKEVITQLDDGVWRVDGSYAVDDCLELGWPVEEGDDYETLAGWLLDKTDTVPESGFETEIDGWRFVIEKMRRNRIQWMRVERL